ncbi:MAG TPA: GntR family transcriptional regulator [Clostridiales bacterium]|nr:GntR family transcriptional regulator [Clostridiales bacterium]
MLDNSLSLYLAIARDLTETIKNGTYLYQQLLPTETKLMKKYSVSRTTIRQAVNLLVSEGLLSKVQGSGTYVIYRKENDLIKRSSAIFPFSEEMRTKGKTCRTKLLSFEIIPATKSVSETLGIEINDQVYSFERLRFGNDLPLCVEHSYMPVAPYPDLTIHHLEGSKYDYIENIKKMKIAYSHQKVSAIMSTERIEKLLNLKKHSPILKIMHTTYLENGDILDFTTIYFSSDYYEAHFIKLRQKPML